MAAMVAVPITTVASRSLLNGPLPSEADRKFERRFENPLNFNSPLAIISPFHAPWHDWATLNGECKGSSRSSALPVLQKWPLARFYLQALYAKPYGGIRTPEAPQ
jgi:hypothetical protein